MPVLALVGWVFALPVLVVVLIVVLFSVLIGRHRP